MKHLIFLIYCLLASVFVFAQRSYQQELDKKYSSPLFKSDNAHVIVPMDDPGAPSYQNVFQYLQGRVPGLLINVNNIWRPFVGYRMGYPAFFLDEIRVDITALTNVNMNDIAVVKVFRPPFMGAIGGGYGAIAVYTKDGDEEEGEVEAR